MMIEHSGYAVAQTPGKRPASRQANLVECQGPVEFPPQVFQALNKAGGRINRHTGCKGGIEMVMCADESGNYQPAVDIKYIKGRIQFIRRDE